jgi:MOSC domain-containing protein YiiM
MTNTPQAIAKQQVLSIQTGKIQPLLVGGGKTVMSAIDKTIKSDLERPERIAVKPLGLFGDEQADPTVHGSLSKAVYAYPQEHFGFWQTVRAQAGVAAWDAPMPPGLMGENLTLTGLLEADAYIGDVLQFPDCALAISEPRYPCFKFEARMFKQASKLMMQSGYCGFYLSVRREGSIAAGEHYSIVPGSREVRIRELFMAKAKRTPAD